MSDLLAYAKQHLSYDHETGIFIRLTGEHKGERAGYLCTKGHRQLKLAGRAYMAHRIAWLMHYGEMPKQQIDHMNREKDDNRIANLRDVSGTHNIQNQISPSRNNKSSGARGVHRWGKKWIAQIRVDGTLISIGRFDNIPEASEAYLAAKLKYHPGTLI